jgi:hypothetical protein
VRPSRSKKRTWSRAWKVTRDPKNHGDVVVFPAKTEEILWKTYRIWDSTGDIVK